MQGITSNGVVIRPVGPMQTAGAMANYGDGGTFGQSNGALILLQRAGRAVDASQKIRDFVANSSAFGETFQSDYGRVDWTEAKIRTYFADGKDTAYIVALFQAKEQSEWDAGIPKASQPRKVDMAKAILNGTERELADSLVMKDRVAVAMHNAKRTKIAPDVKRFTSWLETMEKRIKDGGSDPVKDAPLSNRAMKRLVRNFINTAKEGVSVLDALKGGLDEAITDQGTAALNNQPTATVPTVKPMLRSVPVSALPSVNVPRPVYTPFTFVVKGPAKRTARKAK